MTRPDEHDVVIDAETRFVPVPRAHSSPIRMLTGFSRRSLVPMFLEVEGAMSDSGSGASARIAALFETRQGVPISRNEVMAIASQLDYMKRIRRNGGARDILDEKGIAILWGGGDSDIIASLGLGDVGDDEFISYRPRTTEELEALRKAGHPLKRPSGL